MTEANPWRAKAKALDRYRWRLLRQRHSVLGSALRFGRDVLLDWGFGLLALCRLNPKVSAKACDILLLQAAPKVIPLARKKQLIAALRHAGYTLEERALADPATQLGQRLLVVPPQRVPLRYLGYAAHAQWLVEHYQPAILLNDRNGSLYSPFLRLALQARGGLLVHLAHATTVESSRRLSMNDYDYYFLFGRSSLEALQRRPLRFGASQAVLAGSHMIDQRFDLPPADPKLKTLLILGVGPDKEKEPGYQRTYALLRDWAAEHPEFRVLVKSHPRSARAFWQAAAEELSNLQLLPLDCALPDALTQASLVVNIMSNAVIEAALARRPVLYVNASGQEDIFQQTAFFGPCIRDAAELAQRMAAIQQDYPRALAASAAFAEYHLAQGCAGLDNTVALLAQLRQGQSCVGEPLPAAGMD